MIDENEKENANLDHGLPFDAEEMEELDKAYERRLERLKKAKEEKLKDGNAAK